MAISVVDRRISNALLGASKRIKTITAQHPHAVTLVAVAHAIAHDSYTAYKAAIDAEDKEDIEADLAVTARQEAFEDLSDAFRRLYAGLVAGVNMAVMQGDRKADVSKLRTYLSNTAPSALSVASFGNALQTVDSAMMFFDAFIPEPGRKELKTEITRALEAAREAYGVAETEVGEATDARNRLIAQRAASREDYVAAREVLGAALRLDGMSDRLNATLPPLGRLLGRRASGADPSLLASDEAIGSDDLDDFDVLPDDI